MPLGASGEGPGLLLGGVGGVVGGDGVDGAVPQAGDDPLHILLCPQGGIDPGQGPLRQDLVLCEGKILGAGLAGNGHPRAPSYRRTMSTAFAVEIWQMWTAAPVSSASMAVPRHHPAPQRWRAVPPARAGGIRCPRSPPGPPPCRRPHSGRGQAAPAGWPVSWRPASGWRCPRCSPSSDRATAPASFSASASVSSCPSRPHGHRRDGVDVDAAPLLGPLPHIVQLLRAVQHRVRVGHTGQGGDPSPGRRSRAGARCPLYRSYPGLPQVYVHVHQARRSPPAPRRR